MAIVKMRKLSVIGMDEEKKALLKELMKLGAVEVTAGAEKLADEKWRQLVKKDSDDEQASKCDREITRAEQAIAVLMKYSGVKKPLFASRKAITTAQYAELLLNVDSYGEKVTELLELEKDISRAFTEENQAAATIASLTPWVTYDAPLEITGTENTTVATGVFPPATDLAALRGELEDAGYGIFIEEINKDKDQIYTSIIVLKADEEEAMKICKNYGYSAMPLNNFEGSVSSNIDLQKEVIEKCAKTREGLEEELKEKADYEMDVKYYHDIMVVQKDEAGIRNSLLLTEETFTFDAWVPAEIEEKLATILDKYTCWYEFNDPEEDDDVPVQLKNNSFFTPIEFVTELYSLPSYREVDPTSIFAIFYIIFFGIMFGDVGYGLIIIAATYLIVKKYNLKEGGTGTYKLMRTLFYSGISSVFWGVMFGSFFGDLIPVIADTFFDKTVTINPLWLDPAKEPMVFLVFACGLGVVHLFVGMGIKAYEEIKAGQILDSVKDVFAWYFIVLGLIMWIFGSTVSDALPTIGKVLTIVGVVLALVVPIITAQGASKALGAWDLYSGITGNLSDILSYSRLLGLGLASTSIAQVFNFLASMGGKGVVGVIVFLLIGTIGHALNFAINALGAFVHSCRLQYVEFFGKFYEGGGRAFEPLGNNTKYIRIIEEEN